MMLDDFKIGDGKIHLTTLFRSPILGGLSRKPLQISRLLEYVANRVETKPGTITTISISAHIYDHDWNLIENS